MSETVLTIGHSTHSINRLIELLKLYEVSVVGDVRSQPYSRMNPQFNRETLKAALYAAEIKYVFLGEELGARSDDKNCYCNGRVQYDRLAETKLFKNGIQRVVVGAKKYRIALLCAEKDPLSCHRTILVARHLIEQRIRVQHILPDGRLEEHADAMDRLINLLQIPTSDFFRSPDEILKEAYAQQGNTIAYEEESDEASDQRLRGKDITKASG